MSDLTIPEIKTMLQDRVGDLAARLAPNGKRKGGYWMGPSPLRADSVNDTFGIWLSGAARGAFKDFVSGDKGDVIDLVAMLACGGGCPPSRESRGEALAWSRDFLGVSGRDPARARTLAKEASERRAQREAAEEAERARKWRRAFDLWLAGGAMRDSAADGYLWTRGVDARAIPNLEASLRFARRVEHPLEPHVGPAMLGKFSDASGNFAALHVTFVKPDGSGKADVAKPKIIFGGFAGAAVRISRGASGLKAEEAALAGIREPLTLLEGIEKALLAAQERPEWRVWAAGSLDNLGNQPALPCVSNFLVIKDNDVKPAAVKALERGLEKLRAKGLPVDCFGAIGGAKDLTDLLKGVDV